eukprot:TRINITY_DN46777_c0_g1_i1.p1 TRINITY_DN46777_c0_g1~~TRINITY_DN46777_c0_g1_i1.p1  ORF type:complete len:357 (+),score=94.33 TRINITY_DN46777_c0_g1_i1:63-1073(+)
MADAPVDVPDAPAAPAAVAGSPTAQGGKRRGRVRRREGSPEQAGTEADAVRIKQFIDGLRFSKAVGALEDPSVKQRRPCPRCGKKRQFYCYDCVLPTDSAALPRQDVPLPLDVHVVLHPGEHRGKATSVQAGVLSSNVRLYTHPEIPQQLDPASTLLVYPCPEARTLGQLRDDGALDRITGIVFVDSTWHQSKSICRDERLMRLTPVQLNEYRTMFWRFQNTGDERFLATVEAIYYFVRDFSVARGRPYSGEFDDLLYFYVHQYACIQNRYKTEGRAFTKRHQKAGEYIRPVDFSYLLCPPGSSAQPAADLPATAPAGAAAEPGAAAAAPSAPAGS